MRIITISASQLFVSLFVWTAGWIVVTWYFKPAPVDEREQELQRYKGVVGKLDSLYKQKETAEAMAKRKADSALQIANSLRNREPGIKYVTHEKVTYDLKLPADSTHKLFISNVTGPDSIW